jgi:hypothetical protein
MPVLKNPRWERLAQELAQNKTASEAMILAGYSDVRNSTRLTKKEEIRRRVEELQSRGAERAEVSVASLLQELEAAREKASNLDQLSAAVRAIEAKAKVSGLLVQKVEVTNIDSQFDEAETIEDVMAAMVAAFEADGYSFSEYQRRELAARFTAFTDFLTACKPKPAYVIEGNSPADIRSRLINKPMKMSPVKLGDCSPRRLTNGQR